MSENPWNEGFKALRDAKDLSGTPPGLAAPIEVDAARRLVAFLGRNIEARKIVRPGRDGEVNVLVSAFEGFFDSMGIDTLVVRKQWSQRHVFGAYEAKIDGKKALALRLDPLGSLIANRL